MIINEVLGHCLSPFLTIYNAHVCIWPKRGHQKENYSRHYFLFCLKAWTGKCGGHYTEPTGKVASPYFPNNYNNMADCTYTIETAPGTTIELEFKELDAELAVDCKFDSVQVHFLIFFFMLIWIILDYIYCIRLQKRWYNTLQKNLPHFVFTTGSHST